MELGKGSIQFQNSVYVESHSSYVGKKEYEGPLGQLFDAHEDDPMCGRDSWEQAESELQKRAVHIAFSKGNYTPKDIDFVFAGDLLWQDIGSTFGLKDFDIPLLGLYGACSTMGESLCLGSMVIQGQMAQHVLCVTSSHFAGAEKQFRFPLDYGAQRPPCATWTVTGSGAVVLGTRPSNVRITGVTIGKVVDLGITDSMNMGAAMAPAAADTIARHLRNFGEQPKDYDKIITGDLGVVGKKALLDLMEKEKYNIEKQHTDCGLEIYSREAQDVHSGGSGCGCAATVFSALIMRNLEEKRWKRVLFVPTGALLSTVSYNEGESVPGIAHAVVLERV